MAYMKDSLTNFNVTFAGEGEGMISAVQIMSGADDWWWETDDYINYYWRDGIEPIIPEGVDVEMDVYLMNEGMLDYLYLCVQSDQVDFGQGVGSPQCYESPTQIPPGGTWGMTPYFVMPPEDVTINVEAGHIE